MSEALYTWQGRGAVHVWGALLGKRMKKGNFKGGRLEEREDGPLTPLEKDFGLTKGSAVCRALVNFVPGDASRLGGYLGGGGGRGTRTWVSKPLRSCSS